MGLTRNPAENPDKRGRKECNRSWEWNSICQSHQALVNLLQSRTEFSFLIFLFMHVLWLFSLQFHAWACRKGSRNVTKEWTLKRSSLNNLLSRPMCTWRCLRVVVPTTSLRVRTMEFEDRADHWFADDWWPSYCEEIVPINMNWQWFIYLAFT